MKELIFRADDLATGAGSKRRAFVELVYQVRVRREGGGGGRGCMWEWMRMDVLGEGGGVTRRVSLWLGLSLPGASTHCTRWHQMDEDEEIEGFAPGTTLSFKRTISPTGTSVPSVDARRLCLEPCPVCAFGLLTKNDEPQSSLTHSLPPSSLP